MRRIVIVKSRKIKSIAVILWGLLAAGCCMHNKDSCTCTLSEDAFLKIAARVARQYNLDLEGYEMQFDRDNQQWEKFLRTLETYDPKQARNLKKFFRCRCYQAVLLFPKTYRPGGAFWVFMDPKTGKVIKILTEV